MPCANISFLTVLTIARPVVLCNYLLLYTEEFYQFMDAMGSGYLLLRLPDGYRWNITTTTGQQNSQGSRLVAGSQTLTESGGSDVTCGVHGRQDKAAQAWQGYSKPRKFLVQLLLPNSLTGNGVVEYGCLSSNAFLMVMSIMMEIIYLKYSRSGTVFVLDMGMKRGLSLGLWVGQGGTFKVRACNLPIQLMWWSSTLSVSVTASAKAAPGVRQGLPVKSPSVQPGRTTMLTPAQGCKPPAGKIKEESLFYGCISLNGVPPAEKLAGPFSSIYFCSNLHYFTY